MNEKLIIFHKSYQFTKWLLEHTNKYPKSHRFSVAVQLENAMLDFLRKITVANHRKQKISVLRAADEDLLTVRMLTQLSHEMRFLNTKSFEYAARCLDEIGRLLGGWLKSQTN